MKRAAEELLPGTFEMLILKALSLGDMHGWGISERIGRLSGDVFVVQQGAVYPALQRLLRGGFILARWEPSANGRRARFYTLTASGRRRLDVERSWWERASGGVAQILTAATQES